MAWVSLVCCPAVQVGASKAPRSDKWLRQALAASQRDSPAPSPAIQWTGTPDTVQALCGKSSSISSLLSRATQTEEIGDAAKAAPMISLPTRESGKRCASAMVRLDLLKDLSGL